MQKNFKLTIEYDGSGFHGWQVQKGDPTIQAAIEKALANMVGQRVRLIGAGRTDAGVHAIGQVANFNCNTRLGAETLQKGLNSLLPPDIVIRECRQVAPSFHARFDCKSKQYRYTILNQPIPEAIGRQYAWFVRQPLDTQAMQSALEQLVGRHNFSAFEGAGSPRQHSTRTIMAAAIEAAVPGRIEISIEAEGFLRYMVRNIVGTLVAVGSGKLTAAQVITILASGDRSRAPATAPPHGLCLVKVNY
jgi:tRNA pseudouridine38-40 synthase